MDIYAGKYFTGKDRHGQKRGDLLLALHFGIMAFVITIVALTAYHPALYNLLRGLTRENGLFEWGSVLILFILSIYSFRIFLTTLQKGKNPGNIYRLIFLCIAIGGILAVLEEISWGQHILEFNPAAFFSTHNLQRETNIHNLVPATLFNGIIFAFVYICFIFMPALHRIFRFTVPSYVLKLFPSTHTTLIFAFASSLQAYFSYSVTYLDTAALWSGLILLALMICTEKKPLSAGELIHLTAVMFCALFFMLNHGIFDYHNMQYEIREAIIAYGVLVWFHDRTACLSRRDDATRVSTEDACSKS